MRKFPNPLTAPHGGIVRARTAALMAVFVVSQDLEFFVHGHPSLVANGLFHFPLTFPKPVMYRVPGDFYPLGGLQQLSSETAIGPGRYEVVFPRAGA